MADRYDLLIRGGTVVDGTGAAAREADVALRGSRIAAVGSHLGQADEEIDARGLLVTPGFVDVHTHYDGQAIWDSRMQPSSWHGVTTAVMGNCGVGFAPVRRDDRQKLIELMEGVEDIPGAVLHEGLNWNWESFGDYLDTKGFTPDDMPYGKLLLGPRTELYNIRDDLSETKDLAAAQPAKAQQLKAALEAWWRETGAKFPDKNPAYDPATWWSPNAGPAEGKAKAKKKA